MKWLAKRPKMSTGERWPRPSTIAHWTRIYVANAGLQCDECGAPVDVAVVDRIDYEAHGAWVRVMPCAHLVWIDYRTAVDGSFT